MQGSDTRQKLVSFLSVLHSNLNRRGPVTFPAPSTTTKSETPQPQRVGKNEIVQDRQLISKESQRTAGNRKCLCDICGAVVSQLRQKEHIKRHNTDRPFQCEKCPKRFKDSAQLQSHQRTCHCDTPRFFYCDFCDKALRCKRALRKHLHQFHVPDKALKCEECGRPFGDKARLKRHYNVHKRARNEFVEAPKKFECQDCGKLFATNTHLKQHSGVHTKLKSYVCGYCQQGFNFFSSMRNHERNVHGKVKKDSVQVKERKIEVGAYAEISSAETNAEMADVAKTSVKADHENQVVIDQNLILADNSSILYLCE